MSSPIRYTKCSVPLFSGDSCTFEGEFLPEAVGRRNEPGLGQQRTRLLVFDAGNLIRSDVAIAPGSSRCWDFHFSVRIPSRADRCRIVFELKSPEGHWEEIGSDDIFVRAFPSGWIRLRVSALLEKYRILRSRLLKHLGKVFPWLIDWTPSEQWARFSVRSDGPGPRNVWSKRLSDVDRKRIWRHVYSSAGCFGSFFQYEGREVDFDRFPILDAAEHLIPKLTVVTPSYNQARFLGATMDSVATEAGNRIDYIVMDGGSTDHSTEVIQERSAKVRYWQSKPDKGQAAAVAEGFLQADCGPEDIMAYLNSDDLFCPDVIDFVLRWFALHPEVDVVYGHRIIIDEAGHEVGRWVLPPHDPEVLSLVDFIPQETLFWRKRVYDEVGGIDPSFQFAMDWDFLLKLNRAGARFERLPWFLGCFRVHDAQKTHLHLNDSGAREISLLRRREHGDIPSAKSIQDAVIKTSVESLWYAERISKGERR